MIILSYVAPTSRWSDILRLPRSILSWIWGVAPMGSNEDSTDETRRPSLRCHRSNGSGVRTPGPMVLSYAF